MQADHKVSELEDEQIVIPVEAAHAYPPAFVVVGSSSSSTGVQVVQASRAGVVDACLASLEHLMASVARGTEQKEEGEGGSRRDWEVVAVAGLLGHLGEEEEEQPDQGSYWDLHKRHYLALLH